LPFLFCKWVSTCAYKAILFPVVSEEIDSHISSCVDNHNAIAIMEEQHYSGGAGVRISALKALLVPSGAGCSLHSILFHHEGQTERPFTYFICYFAFKDIHTWSIEDGTRFKWIFYFSFFLIGGGYRLHYDQEKKTLGAKSSLLLLIVSFIAFYGFKFVLDRKPTLMPLQFIEHAILIAFVLATLITLTVIEPKLKILSTRRAWKPVKFMSGITLEVFLVMDYVLKYSEVKSFPVSLLLVIVRIIGTAWLLHIT